MGDGLQTGKASCYITDDSGQLNSTQPSVPQG